MVRSKKMCGLRRMAVYVMALALILAAMGTINVKADVSVSGVLYLNPNFVGETLNGFVTATMSNGIKVSGSAVTWQGGPNADTPTWYVVNETVEIAGRITVSGYVNLLLCDGCTLTAPAGITVSNEDPAHPVNGLTIFAQSEGNETGALEINIQGTYDAAIGGSSSSKNGSHITINGGVITATGGSNGFGGAGIGGSRSGDGSNITINGGKVTATGGKNSAGIGGGSSSSGSNITINGGTVIATGASQGAGIGGGASKPGYDITITGGTVNATGGGSSGNGAAGIGGGYNAPGYGITISGGVVKADGGIGSPAIGNGYHGNYTGSALEDVISISGGSITATGSGNFIFSAIGANENYTSAPIELFTDTTTLTTDMKVFAGASSADRNLITLSGSETYADKIVGKKYVFATSYPLPQPELVVTAVANAMPAKMETLKKSPASKLKISRVQLPSALR